MAMSISIEGPGSAPAGASVALDVLVKNPTSTPWTVALYGYWGGDTDNSIGLPGDLFEVQAYTEEHHYGSFIMPGNSTSVIVQLFVRKMVGMPPTEQLLLEDEDAIIISLETEPPPPPEYTIVTQVSPAGAGYVTKLPDLPTYPANTWVLVSAFSNEGYTFDHWTHDSFYGLEDPIIEVIASEDVLLTAYFVPVAPPFEGAISRKELEYDQSQSSIPVS